MIKFGLKPSVVVRPLEQVSWAQPALRAWILHIQYDIMQVRAKFIGGKPLEECGKVFGGTSTLWSLQNSLGERECLGEAVVYE